MKGLKISACTLLFVLLSACGISGNHQESAAGSDMDVSLEKQESNSQAEEVNMSISQEETSQVSEYEEKNETVLQGPFWRYWPQRGCCCAPRRPPGPSGRDWPCVEER